MPGRAHRPLAFSGANPSTRFQRRDSVKANTVCPGTPPCPRNRQVRTICPFSKQQFAPNPGCPEGPGLARLVHCPRSERGLR
jgi:hypothetical protein